MKWKTYENLALVRPETELHNKLFWFCWIFLKIYISSYKSSFLCLTPQTRSHKIQFNMQRNLIFRFIFLRDESFSNFSCMFLNPNNFFQFEF